MSGIRAILSVLAVIVLASGCGAVDPAASDDSGGSSDGTGSSGWTEETLSWSGDVTPVTSTCTITLSDGSYRMYFVGPGGILSSTSTDGLTWSSGVVGLSTAMATNPAVIELEDGAFLMIYGIQTTTPVTEKLFRATSSDGITFTDQPGTEEDGAVLVADADENDFVSVPDLIYLTGATLRIYFVANTVDSRIHTATSTDNGQTWTREGEITLTGSYGGQTNDPDIVLLEDGSYRLFFTTPPEGTSIGDLRLRSATSTDGRTFTVETGEIQTPSGSIDAILDPDTVLVTGTSQYRSYYGTEPAGDLHAIISP